MTFYSGLYNNQFHSTYGYGLGGQNGYRFGSPYGYYWNQYRHGSPYGYRSFGSLYGNRGLIGYGGNYGYGGLYGLGYGYPFFSNFGNRYGYGNCYSC
ncbi:keratin-associated protein 21-1-like [Cuculus canorus]|uniref:keratin-associated protein 21-1-like n=1 Tax=Cuculus canorus TaxID=55661 RepID=UPI00051C4E36|nr:keratin-associated protein 21-1-like [Cuculus canorus]